MKVQGAGTDQQCRQKVDRAITAPKLQQVCPCCRGQGVVQLQDTGLTSHGMVSATPAAISSAALFVLVKMMAFPDAPCTVRTSMRTAFLMFSSTWTAKALWQHTSRFVSLPGGSWCCSQHHKRLLTVYNIVRGVESRYDAVA